MVTGGDQSEAILQRMPWQRGSTINRRPDAGARALAISLGDLLQSTHFRARAEVMLGRDAAMDVLVVSMPTLGGPKPSTGGSTRDEGGSPNKPSRRLPTVVLFSQRSKLQLGVGASVACGGLRCRKTLPCLIPQNLLNLRLPFQSPSVLPPGVHALHRSSASAAQLVLCTGRCEQHIAQEEEMKSAAWAQPTCRACLCQGRYWRSWC